MVQTDSWPNANHSRPCCQHKQDDGWHLRQVHQMCTRINETLGSGLTFLLSQRHTEAPWETCLPRRRRPMDIQAHVPPLDVLGVCIEKQHGAAEGEL